MEKIDTSFQVLEKQIVIYTSTSEKPFTQLRNVLDGDATST